MIDGNDAAFARPFFSGGGDFSSEQDGLTKREYFAGLAMQGIISRKGTLGAIVVDFDETNFYRVAGITAVSFADALIAALNETK